MKMYFITVTDSAVYEIEANSEDIAVEIALDYFAERDHDITVDMIED